MTNEASDTTRWEPQHNYDVEHANVNTEFERVCCNYPEQLTGKRFAFNPATILNSIRSRCSGGDSNGLPEVYTLRAPYVSARVLADGSVDEPPLYAITFSRISSRPSAVKSARITFIACESARSTQACSL